MPKPPFPSQTMTKSLACGSPAQPRPCIAAAKHTIITVRSIVLSSVEYWYVWVFLTVLVYDYHVAVGRRRLGLVQSMSMTRPNFLFLHFWWFNSLVVERSIDAIVDFLLFFWLEGLGIERI